MNRSPSQWPDPGWIIRTNVAWPKSRGLQSQRGWPQTNALWLQAGCIPSLDLRFAESKTLTDAVTGQNLITFSRTTTATYVAGDGLRKIAAVNEPRFDHDPITGQCLGLLVEEARTNYLLNSATLNTQSYTATAVSHTLSFYGTGTVTLTGVSTAGPLAGTDANTRVSLTFTPTAGSLTLTVSGSVTNAQLERDTAPSSYIPTTTAAFTRATDVVSVTGSNFSSFYRRDEGTLYARGSSGATTDTVTIAQVDDGTVNQRIGIRRLGASDLASFVVTDGALTQAAPSLAGSFADAMGTTCIVYALNDFHMAFNGTLGFPDKSGTVPVVDRLLIGQGSSGSKASGRIARIIYWPQRLSNSTLQALTL